METVRNIHVGLISAVKDHAVQSLILPGSTGSFSQTALVIEPIRKAT